MHPIEALIPRPGLAETDQVEVRASPEEAWQAVRTADLGGSPLVRALFALRTLPARLAGKATDSPTMRVDDITRTDRPGFRMLVEEPGRTFVVGAIARVWEADIPFADVRDPAAFAAFAEPGWTKVAWSILVEPVDPQRTRISLLLRVATTDEASWPRFRRYFRFIGIGSRFIRRHVLANLAHRLGPA